MPTFHILAYRDCTAFGAAVESPHRWPAISAALARGELIEVQGHRFRLCRSGSGWKIKAAALWQMTHRQRLARLLRCLRLGGDEVLWEARVRRFVKHCAIRVEGGGGDGGARPRMVPLYVKGWLPPALDHGGLSEETREAGRRRLAELLRYGRRPQAEPDGASEGTEMVPPHSEPAMPAGIDLRRLCPDVAAKLFGPGADLRGRNLRDSCLGALDLRGADLRGAVLIRCEAVRANLAGADLQGADLRLADLRGANLDRAKLSGARLGAAQLQNASLEGADLRGQTLYWMALGGATLSGADLTGARFVLPQEALIDRATRQAALKPLHQRDGNLLWTVASLSDPKWRRELMTMITRAVAGAIAHDEDVCDAFDALAEVLLKDIDDYWVNPRDMSANLELNVWILRLAAYQCQRLAEALPEACEGALLELVDQYRTMFVKRGALSWELPLKLRSQAVSRA